MKLILIYNSNYHAQLSSVIFLKKYYLSKLGNLSQLWTIVDMDNFTLREVNIVVMTTTNTNFTQIRTRTCIDIDNIIYDHSLELEPERFACNFMGIQINRIRDAKLNIELEYILRITKSIYF